MSTAVSRRSLFTGRLRFRPPVAELDAERCWAALGQPCDYCVLECPLGERALRMVNGRPLVDPEHCDGCGRCEYICTATPPAIQVLP